MRSLSVNSAVTILVLVVGSVTSYAPAGPPANASLGDTWTRPEEVLA